MSPVPATPVPASPLSPNPVPASPAAMAPGSSHPASVTSPEEPAAGAAETGWAAARRLRAHPGPRTCVPATAGADGAAVRLDPEDVIVRGED